MGAHRRTRKSRAAAALAALTIAAGGAMTVVGVGTAAADETLASQLTLTYDCPFPLIGNDQVEVSITADIPDHLDIGEPSGEISIDTVTTVGELATQGLNVVGARTLTGTGISHTTVRGPGVELPLEVPVELEETEIPPSGTFDTVATGVAPSVQFDQDGDVVVEVNELVLTLTPLTADGQETGLGTFESACELDPPDQDNVLHRGTVGEGGGEPGEEPGEENGEENGEEPGEENGEQPGEENGEQPGEDNGEQPGEESGQQPGEESGTPPGDGGGSTSGGTSGAPQLSGGAELSGGAASGGNDGGGGSLAQTGAGADVGLMAFGIATMVAGGVALRYLPRMMNRPVSPS